MVTNGKRNMRFFKETFFVFIIKVFGAAFAFFNQVVLSRHLGIEEYGSLSVFLSLANVLILFPLFGMDTGIIRSVAGFENRVLKKSLLISSLKFVTLLLIFFVAIFFAFDDFILSGFNLSSQLNIYLIIYVALLAYSKILDGFLQGNKKTLLQNFLTQFLTNIIKLLSYVVLFQLFNNIFIAVQIMCGAELIMLVVKSVYVSRTYRDVKLEPYSKSDFKEYLIYCIPLFFVSSIDMIQISLNKFFTSYLMGNSEVGLIRVFENYSAVLAMFVMPFVTMWPLMSEYYNRGKLDELKELFQQTTILIAFLIIPAWITLTICNSEILGIFGINAGDITNAKLIMFIFFLGTVFDAIVGPAGALLQMTNYSKISLYNSLSLLFLNIILCMVLIPRYGLLGVAISTSTAIILINTLNVIQNKRLFNLFPYGKMHLLLLVVAIPIYFIGLQLKEFLGQNYIINIGVIGLYSYLIYFLISFVFYRESFLKLLAKLKLQRKGN